jgi:uncharacterized integral membrane protein
MRDYWLMLTPWKKFKFIVSIISVIFVVIFAIVNWQEAEINFLFFKIKISITLLIVICLLAGYITSTLFDFRKYKLKDREISKLKLRIKELESSSENLKTIED